MMIPEFYDWQNAELMDGVMYVRRFSDDYQKPLTFDRINEAIEQNLSFEEENPEKPNRLAFWEEAKRVYDGLVASD